MAKSKSAGQALISLAAASEDGRRIDLREHEMDDHDSSLESGSKKTPAKTGKNTTGSSTAQTAWNIANAVQGVSALSLPYAVSQGGLVALVAFLVIAVLSSYTGKILVECLYDILPRDSQSEDRKAMVRINNGSLQEGRPLLAQRERRRLCSSYVEVGGRAWRRGGRPLVLVTQCAELIGVSSLSLLLLGHALTQLVDNRLDLSQEAWTAICAVAVLPSVFLPKLSQISWLSLVGLVTMSGVVVSMIVYSATHPLVITSFSQLPAFDVTTCPIAIGIVVFSYAAHAQFPDMERSMAVPERFPRAINAAFIYVTVLYIGVAASGFLTFGKDADEIVSKNMTKPIRTIINVLLLINLLLSYALPMFPVATIFERFLRHFFPLCGKRDSEDGLSLFYHFSARTFLVGVTLMIAITVPHFSLLVAFIGSLTCVLICFVFPCVFHLAIHGRRLTLAEKTLDVLVALVTTSAGATGVYASLSALVS